MTNFSHRIRSVEIAADSETCDHLKFVLGHYGEDSTRIRDTYRREHPTVGCAVVVFTHDARPRAELCSPASLNAALPMIETAVKALPEADRKAAAIAWCELYERAGAAYGKTMQRMAGL